MFLKATNRRFRRKRVEGKSPWCIEVCRVYILGYNDFNNLVLPGSWWLQNLILRHNYKIGFSFFKPFRPRLTSKLAKKLILKKILFFRTVISVPKNAEFDADFESVEKFAKNACEKSYQRTIDRKMQLLTFVNVFKSFPPITFWMHFLQFHQRLRTQHQFLGIMILISNFWDKKCSC